MSDEDRTPEPPPHPRSGPAPLYGEYATPEEVAAITGVPLRHAIPPVRPAYPDPASVPPPVGTPAPRATDRVPGRRPHPLWDRAITIALLVTGAWTAFDYLIRPRQFGDALQAFAATSGFTGDVIDGTIDGIGQVVGVALVVLVALGVVTTILAARRGVRILFWIPLTGAVLSVVVLVIAFAIALQHVPGLLEALQPR